MKSRADRHAGFRTLVQCTDRHFQFERVTPCPDAEKIRTEVLNLAAELKRLGLDSLAGCRPKPIKGR